MKTLTSFFVLFGFLAAFIGCHASTQVSAPTPQVAHTAPPAATSPAPTAPKPEDPQIGSLHNDVRNSPLARYARGEEVPPARLQALCVETGNFNVADDGQTIQMEMVCTPGASQPEDGFPLMKVEDIVVPRLPGKHLFRILFKDAVVSVQDLDTGEREVRLHYRDSREEFHHVILAQRQGEKYKYSFADLAPDTLGPIGVFLDVTPGE